MMKLGSTPLVLRFCDPGGLRSSEVKILQLEPMGCMQKNCSLNRGMLDSTNLSRMVLGLKTGLTYFHFKLIMY
jgi:hypothetical protein